MEGAASAKELARTGDRPSVKAFVRASWSFGIKRAALAAAVVALLGILAFAAIREATITSRAPSSALSQPASTAPQRPAFTRAEEVYIQALWPIHGDVERSAVRVSLGNIFYKI